MIFIHLSAKEYTSFYLLRDLETDFDLVLRGLRSLESDRRLLRILSLL